MKSVFLKGRSQGGLPHSLYEELLRNPPEGYQIFADKSGDPTQISKVAYTERQNQFDRIDRRFQRYTLTRGTWREVRTLFYKGLKTAQSLRRQDSPEADLIYASQQLVSGDKPWIVDMECADSVIDYGDIRLLQRSVKKSLGSKCCKKVIPWSNWSKRTLLRSLDCSSFRDKIETVHFGMRAKNFVKKKEGGKVKLLFVGSTNHLNYLNFEWKGGIELVEAFSRISKKYDVELTLRSWVPPETAAKCAKIQNLRLISAPLTNEELAALYLSADVFMFPSYVNLGMVLLEAMSYELPIVAPRIFDVPEAITDMETGVLLDSPNVPFYAWNGIPNHYNPEVLLGVRRVREWRVKQVMEKMSMLIEDGSLRRRLGRSARRVIEEGEFSLKNRNRKLKRIFDEATQRL